MEPITRREALSQGLTHFFTGKPCKHDHISNRYVNSGVCVECMIIRVKAHQAKYRKIELRTTKASVSNPRVYKFVVELPLAATEEQRAVFATWVQNECVQAFFGPLGLISRNGVMK